MTVDEYRKKHRRCTTCVHSEERYACWYCQAKKRRHFGSVFDTRIKGMFCQMYEPIKKIKE